MSQDADTCLNCGATIKSGVFTANERIRTQDVEFINVVLGENLEDACNKCSANTYSQACGQFVRKLEELKGDLEKLLAFIPLTSIQNPLNWEYTVLGLVTSQSVTGTGIFSDVTSAFTDLFGAQSGAYNKKIRAGEDLCRTSLRAQAFQLGGNAVIGVDVDYAEVGGQRAMLMVCMTGTAVVIHNPGKVSIDHEEQFAALKTQHENYLAMRVLGQERRLI